MSSTSSPSSDSDSVAQYGWTAVPRSQESLFKELKRSSEEDSLKDYSVQGIPLPDSKEAKQVLEYAKRELKEQTYNHSMRVYYYGERSAGGGEGKEAASAAGEQSSASASEQAIQAGTRSKAS